MMAEFRRASNEFRSTIESEVEAEKIREAMRIEPPRWSRRAARGPDPCDVRGRRLPGGPEPTPPAQPPAGGAARGAPSRRR